MFKKWYLLLMFFALNITTITSIPCSNPNLTRQIVIDIFCSLTTCCADLEHSITACCQDNKNTITACCEDLKQTITTCCSDLNNTITTCCADLKQTITVCCADINHTVTECCSDIILTITLCCESIHFTITQCCQDNKNTITVCCEDIINTITTCCADTNNTITTCCADLKQTITVCCADINHTITACCEDLKQTITTCCSDLNNTITTCCADLKQTITACCADIKHTVTECCSDIILTITLCCESIHFTITQCCQDNKNTITVCCEDIINTITTCCADTNNTITTCCADLKQTITACCADIKHTVTECCSDIINTVTTCCAEIRDIKETITACCHTLNIDLMDINASLTNCCADIIATVTDCCEVLHIDLTNILTTLQVIEDEEKPFISVFGDEIVETRDDHISIQFQYGVSTFDVNTATAGTGTVTSASSMAVVSTGAGAVSSAAVFSRRFLRYRPGHEGYAFFTAVYPNGGVANSTQWVGLLDATDGSAIGYSGVNFAILFRRGGVDTVVTQASFNRDQINGTGPSGFNINPTQMNVFRIAYGWLGASPIKYQVLDQNGDWITFHEILRNNTVAVPSYTNPILPMRAQVTKTAGATNIQVQTASWNAGIIAQPSVAGSRFFAASNTGTVVLAAAETHLLTIRNKAIFQGLTNKIVVRISLVAGGSITVANEISLIRLRTGATVVGLVFTDVNTAQSVMEFSTAGVYTAGTGTAVLTIPNVAFGNGPAVLQLSEKDITILLLPGESLTITGQSLSGGGNDGFATIGWEERFS